MKFRKFVQKGVLVSWIVLGGFIFGGLFTFEVQAQTFPSREIEIVVSYAPGGGADMFSRITGPKVSEILHVPVIVTNKPGASGTIGASYVEQSHEDGYRLVTIGAANLGVMLVTGTKIPYTINDFSAIAQVVRLPLVLVTKKGRWEKFSDLIKEAIQRPGSLTFGSYGTNSSSHLAGELLNQAYGTKIKHVPFDGSSRAMVAALGGHVDLAILTPAPPLPHVRGGNLTPLVIISENRLDDYPGVPTIKELGHPEAVFESYEGFGTSSKVPKDRLEVLRSAFEKALMDKAVQDAIRASGQIPFFRNGKDFDAFLEANLEKIKVIARKAGLAKQ